MRPVGIQLPAENLAANMEARIAKMSPEESQKLDGLLVKQPELREFLQQAISTLEDSHDPDAHTQIAHFLMGRPAQLPSKLASWANNKNFEPDSELAKTLDNLLQTSRFGLIKETSEKTLAKLKNLSGRMENAALKAAFDDGSTSTAPSGKVGQWMYGEEKNSWLPNSTLGTRRKDDFQGRKQVDHTPLLPGLNQNLNIHYHFGKVTDLKGDKDNKAAILMRSNPNLILGEGNTTSKAIMHADGPVVQAALFRENGLPLPSNEGQPCTAPPGIQLSKEGDFLQVCDANDMKESHSIDSIGVFGSTQFQPVASANKAAMKLGTEFLDKKHLILPMQELAHDPYIAFELARQNPNRHVILVFEPVHNSDQMTELLKSTAREINTAGNNASNSPPGFQSFA